MYCISCGKEIGENEAFCRYCGAPQAVANGNNDETVLLNGSRPGKVSAEEKKPAETSKTSQSTDAVAKKKNLIPLLIGGIAAVAVLAVLIFTLSAVAIYNSPEKKYDRQLSLAERYLDELDYEKAIAAYKAAIEIDPNNPEAYKALAELYLAMDDSFSAQNTVQAGINASGDAGLSAMLTEITAEQNAANEPAETVAAEPQVTTGNVTVKVMAANETGAINGAEVKLTGAAGEFSGETGSDGKVSFSELEYGEYTVKCDADGFHKREMTVNVSGSDVSSVVALVPHVAGDDAYVLLTWNGDRDLDLCAFNSDMKEYVNIGHPVDSEGNVFLYADHGADQPYEAIYIHNASAEIAKTIYVADAANARNGSSSQMEADGVTVRVYDSTGLIYESTADTSESAPLWCPCYYYAGTVYDQQDYIYDTTGEQYAWISFDEKDAYTAEESENEDMAWKQAYLKYLENRFNEEYNYYLDDESFKAEVSYNSYRSSCHISFFYLDDDSIPEMTVDGMQPILTFFYGYGVVSFQRGNVVVYGLTGPGETGGMVSYIENEGVFLYEGGGHEEGFEELVKLSDNGFEILNEGCDSWEDFWSTYTHNNTKYNNYDEFVDAIYRDNGFDGNRTNNVNTMSYDEAVVYLSQ